MKAPSDAHGLASKRLPTAASSPEKSTLRSSGHAGRSRSLPSWPRIWSRRLPGRVEDAVRDGVRTEAQPLARQLAEVRGLSNQTIRRLERLEGDLLAERHSRVDDLALLVDLITSGWKGVDQRLARLERKLEQTGRVPANGGGGAMVYRMEERSS